MNEKNIYEELVKTEDTAKVTLPIGIEMEIKTELTLEEQSAFIDRVVDGVFVGEDEEYLPEYRDPVFQITVLQMLTDVPVFEDEDGENVDIEKTYRLCKAIDFFNINNKKFYNLLFRLEDMVDEKIEHMKKVIIAGEKRKLEFIRQEMEDGIAVINSIAENLMNTINEAGDLDGYTAELSKLNDSIQNMDEDELVDSILEFRQKEE